MITNTTKILVPALAAGLLLTLSGCVPYVATGPRVSDDRDIDAVESVLLQTSGDLDIQLGDEPALTISAPQGVMSRLTSDIVDGVLVLGITGPHFGFWQGGDIRYTLTVPRISDIAVEGSGDVTADFTGADTVDIDIDGSGEITGTGIDADEVTIVIEGSGDIELEGRTDSQRIELDGSGDIANEGLTSRDARVEIAGSGDVEVHATKTLHAEISGSGEVRYSGGATVTSDISGSGSVIED